ncbi:hypothetical protein BS333_17400 [Vibrio azureus]|nr:hypothetical protein BS333_17400 [Vibrio azureus]
MVTFYLKNDAMGVIELGLTGSLLPFVIVFLLCGGTFEGLGFKIETNELVDTTIKIKKEFYSNEEDKLLEKIVKILEETNPESPILKEL